MDKLLEAKKELLRAVTCLFIAAPEEAAQDLKEKVNRYVEAAEAKITELETPTIFWEAEYPEDASFSSVKDLFETILPDIGTVVEVELGRSLGKKKYKEVFDEDGDDYNIIEVTEEDAEQPVTQP